MARKTCKTCISWKRDSIKKICGTCDDSRFVYIGDGGACPSDGLGYWDQESWQAGFETGENFGCIHHQKRAN